MISSRTRLLAVAVAVAATALPALAYLLPTGSVLRRMGQKREALNLTTLEVTGMLLADGPSGDRVSAATSRTGGGAVSLPAKIQLRVPGRCRLEIAGPTPAQSATLVLREGAFSGQGGLDGDPSATAFLRAICTLLATSTAGDAAGSYVAALNRRGVAVSDETLGRFDGRIAYVIGGRAREPKPLLYVDKDSFQPLRLIAGEGGGGLQDVRFLGWGSPTGGDWFPRAIEVVQGEQLRLRFTTEKASANAKLPEGLL